MTLVFRVVFRLAESINVTVKFRHSQTNGTESLKTVPKIVLPVNRQRTFENREPKNKMKYQ